MSVFTNLALLATALGTGYYFLEYKPAQERKKKAKPKRAPPPPPPETRVILIDNMQDALDLETRFAGQKIFGFATMAKGSVYTAVAPVFDELSITYPDVNFIEIDMAALLKEMADVDIQSNVALAGGSIQGQPEIGRCVNFFEGPTSFEDELAKFGESMTSDGPECSMADIRTADVVQELVSLAEYINGLSDRSTQIFATRGGGLAGMHAGKGTAQV